MQSNSKKRQDLDDIARWELLLEMLSMERVVPFLPEMGLRFTNFAVIQLIIRQFLEQVEKTEEDTEKEKLLLQQTFLKIAEETDNESAQFLFHWGLRKFSSERQGELSHWALLFRWLAGLSHTQYAIDYPPLDQNKVEAIVQDIREKFVDDINLDQRLEEAEKLHRSNWEEKIYQKSEEDYSPLTLVNICVTEYQTEQILNFIRTLLSNQELETLLQWGRSNAHHFGIRQDRINFPL